jgi:excisionase family DNA binding protein
MFSWKEMDTTETPLLRVTEVADLLGVSKHTVYRRIHDGSLPAVRLSEPTGLLRIPQNELDTWLYGEGSP